MEEKLNLGQKLITNLLNVTTYIFSIDNLTKFEFISQTSFIPTQIFSSYNNFEKFVKNLNNNNIYHLTDFFNISYSFLKIDDWIVMIGPYLINRIKKFEIKEILEKNNLPETLFKELEDYYLSICIIEKNHIILALQTIFHSLYPDMGELNQSEIYMRGTSLEKIYEKSKIRESAYIITHIHNIETQFMEFLSNGNAPEAKLLIKIINKQFSTSQETGKITHEDFSSAYDGHTIARTLIRIAAKSRGVPSTLVDKITTADRIASQKAKSIRELNTILDQTIDSICILITQYHTAQYSPVIKRAVQFILQDLEEPLNVKIISNNVQISESYLSSLFKKEIGLSITDYIRNKRMESAEKYLNFTSMSIQEISSLVGIPDSNYFSRLFKKVYGKTPSDFRKSSTFKKM